MTTDIGLETLDSVAAIAIQTTGEIIVAGYSDSDFALARYTTEGVLDPNFGTDGKVITDIGTETLDSATSVAIQLDGKIVVAGVSDNIGGTNADFALARYTAEGVLDSGFSGDGIVTTDIGIGSLDSATSVAIQSDGKIVVAGYSSSGTDNDFALTRYTVAGALDTTFGTNGKVITPIGMGNDVAYSVAIQSKGNIVVAGYSNSGIDDDDFALASYTPLGAPDPTFGMNGKVTTPIGAGNDVAYSVAIQPLDGKIVVAGSSDNDFALVRYETDGNLDNTFDADGLVTTAIGASDDSAYSVAIQDGKIVAAGVSSKAASNDFALTRYNANGGLDTSFGAGGKVTTAIGAGSVAYAVAIQGGKIVAAGVSAGVAGDDFALVRYLP